MKSSVTVLLVPDQLLRDFYMVKFNNEDKMNFIKTNFHSYQSAASWDVDYADDDAAEEAFDLTNNPWREEERKAVYGRKRSVSTGDIIKVENSVDGTRYFLCDSIGWKVLDLAS